MTRPEPLNAPEKPYTFSDFVHVAQKDLYYGRGIHELVKYARENPCDEEWVMCELGKHVDLPDYELDELGLQGAGPTPRCSNNTKFFMLDFCRFV